MNDNTIYYLQGYYTALILVIVLILSVGILFNDLNVFIFGSFMGIGMIVQLLIHYIIERFL
jgi:hypothetical protein